MQKDSDKDSHGDSCDNCPFTPNPEQEDSNNNGVGDACSKDSDADGRFFHFKIAYAIAVPF